MELKIIPTEVFKKKFKVLIKKYRSLKDDLSKLNETLIKNPKTGILLKKGSVNGNSYEIYKIKLSIRSKGRGKSGGARIVSCFSEERKEVYLLTIYDKSEMDNITDSDLKNIIQTLPFNNLQ